MSDIPIVFSSESVRAILAGTKTQTRRVLNPARLKVRLRHTIVPEMACYLPDAPVAGPSVYQATMNPYCAVCAVVDGENLGVRPGEFDFVLPGIAGTTRLVNKCWTITPTKPCRIWVRETWGRLIGNSERVVYRADGENPASIGRTNDPIQNMAWC